ncbi:MAG: hypothetical protein ACWIPJ_08970, partial [Polaribacter sp.]
MKNWKNIVNQPNFNKLLVINLLFILLCVYIVGGNINSHTPYLKSILFFVGLALLLFSEKKVFNIYIWYILFSILLIDLITNYYRMANHHFLLTYITLIILLYVKGIYNFELLTKNIKYLIIIVIAFAALQKLFSTQFITGQYYYYMLNLGGFFRPFISRNAEIMKTVNFNINNIQRLELMNPNKYNAITLRNIHPNLKLISVLFSWATVLFEFVIAFLLLIKPKSNSTHVLLIVFIIGTFITRSETGFLSI